MKSRALAFFSASNPGVDTGGLYGESKMSVLEKVPKEFLPKTILINAGTAQKEVDEKLRQAGITFPLIAKPDIGERGFLVEKIDDKESLEIYLSRFPVDFLLQEYIDYEHEYNVLFYRMPGANKGNISSVTIKKYLTVTGNGASTVQELMEGDMYAVMQVERFRKEKPKLMQEIPVKGEKLRVEPIGNHARGATFFDGRGMVDAHMLETFNSIAQQIPGMYIFRFDAKCKTPEGLKTGETLKFVEVNGAGGEPTHIYETGYSLFRAWGDLLYHWSIIYRVSRINHQNGVPYMSLREGIAKLNAYLDYKKQLSR